LSTTGGVLAGVAAFGLAGQAAADGKGHPQRGGTLQFGSRLDVPGLDAHRNNQLHTSVPTADQYRPDRY
jgi:hypothetical protein